MKTFYFVRHGESESNVTGIHIGADAELTEHGQKQSEFLARRFKTIPIDHIVASSYKRTRDTAEIFNRELKKPVEYSDLIVEITNPSEIIGLAKDDPELHRIQKLRLEHRTDPDWKYSDEESFTELKMRGLKALTYLLSLPHERIAVVTHGAFMRVMIALMLHDDALTPGEFANILTFFKTKNTGITICEHDPEREVRSGWWILTWNDHAHLGEV